MSVPTFTPPMASDAASVTPESPPVAAAEARAAAPARVSSIEAVARSRLQAVSADVLAMMHTRGLIHVLLVDADNKALGVINARDGLRALLAAGNYEEELLRNYIMGIGYQ